MTSTEIQNLIVSTATSMGVNPALALEVAQVESSYNPNAVSSAGAVGVFQLMPNTWPSLGVTDPTDPTQNVPAGITYISQLLSEFGGDTAQALAAFNWGPTNVSNVVTQQGANWFAAIPSSVQSYVNNILSAVGSQYSVSAGTAATSAPSPVVDTSDGSDSDVSSGLSTGWIVAIGIAALGVLYVLSFGD